MSTKKFVAVTIDQIKKLNTQDHGLVIHRQKIPNFVLVGEILTINEQSTKVQYFITDRTGSIEVALWRQGNDEKVTSMPVLMEKTFCKVFGSSRVDEHGNTYVVALKIVSLESLNELTVHLLEVLYHEKELKINKSKELITRSDSGNMGNTGLNSGIHVIGLNDLQNLLLRIIANDKSERGMSLDQICQAVRPHSKEKIKTALDFLSDEGHIFLTGDTDYYKMIQY